MWEEHILIGMTAWCHLVRCMTNMEAILRTIFPFSLVILVSLSPFLVNQSINQSIPPSREVMETYENVRSFRVKSVSTRPSQFSSQYCLKQFQLHQPRWTGGTPSTPIEFTFLKCTQTQLYGDIKFIVVLGGSVEQFAVKYCIFSVLLAIKIYYFASGVARIKF